MGLDVVNSAPYDMDIFSKAEGVHVFAADTTIDDAGSLISGAAFAQLSAADSLEIVSAQAADTTQKLTLIGILSTGVRAWEVMSLNGTSVVTSANTWLYVENCYLDSKATGNVTLRKAADNVTVNVIAAGRLDADVVHHFSGTTKIPCIASWWCGSSIVAAGTTEFELRWYPAAASCLSTSTGYRVLDRMLIVYDSTGYSVTGEHKRTFPSPIRLSAGGWIAVFGNSLADSTDGYAGMQVFDIPVIS